MARVENKSLRVHDHYFRPERGNVTPSIERFITAPWGDVVTVHVGYDMGGPPKTGAALIRASVPDTTL
jgi:hypothetical protein